MKIYLLMMIIGTLLTAIHFTSAPEQQQASPTSTTRRKKEPSETLQANGA